MEKTEIDDWFDRLIKFDETKKQIMTNDEYIKWVISFAEIHGFFSDEDWFDAEDELSDDDAKKLKNLGAFFDLINEYAERNYIFPISTRFNTTYNVKYQNHGLRVGIMFGQGCSCYCEKAEIDDEKEFVDFTDILTNKRQPQVDYIENELAKISESITLAYHNGLPLTALERTIRNTFSELKKSEQESPKTLIRKNEVEE